MPMRPLVGKVVSVAMNKTAVVQVERRVAHPVYQKIVTKRTKLHVHDEVNDAMMGDTVTIQQCRPVSKMKHHVLVDVVKRTDENLFKIAQEKAAAEKGSA